MQSDQEIEGDPQKPICMLTELDSGTIYEAILVMNRFRAANNLDTLADMQATELGDCRKGQSMPRYDAIVGKRFVQILNVGDHWITVSNLLGKSSHDVYVFDSLHRTVNTSTIVQVTSLLRCEDQSDITFHIREFDKQSNATRLYGFYAVAAAFSCIMSIDPTGYTYDEQCMSRHLQSCISTDTLDPFPSTHLLTSGSTEIEMRTHKLHCLCQDTSKHNSKIMIQCDQCFNWYHEACVGLTDTATPVRVRKVAWRGPCCSRPKTAVDEQVIVIP